MARILILREGEAARRTAALVAATGDEPVLLATHAIVPLAPAFPDGAHAAILVTSANAAPFLRGRTLQAPLLTLGPATAAALKEAGHDAEIAGAGTGHGLVERALALRRRNPHPLLYIAGRVRTDGLEAALAAAEIPVTVLEVYDTRPLDPPPGAVEAALGGGRSPEAVLLLSVGQATAYARLAARLAEGGAPPVALCLSARIAEALPAALAVNAVVAERPSVSELLQSYAGAHRAAG